MGSCNNIETAYIGDIAIDNLESMPDYFLTERDIADDVTGDVVRSLVRTPAGKIIPNGSYDNVTTVVTNNADLDETITDAAEANTVLAGYVSNEGSSQIVYLADSSNDPMFMLIGELTDGQALIQNVGFINIVAGHSYIVGQQYYLGDDGEPVTDSSVTGYKLFIPISTTKLALNMGQ